MGSNRIKEFTGSPELFGEDMIVFLTTPDEALAKPKEHFWTTLIRKMSREKMQRLSDADLELLCSDMKTKKLPVAAEPSEPSGNIPRDRELKLRVVHPILADRTLEELRLAGQHCLLRILSHSNLLTNMLSREFQGKMYPYITLGELKRRTVVYAGCVLELAEKEEERIREQRHNPPQPPPWRDADWDGDLS